MSRALVVAAALAGCASSLTSTSARTIAPGRYEVTGALGAGGVGVVGGERAMPLPDLELGVRRGVADRVDIGAKLFAGGAQLDAKLQLARAGERGWSLSLAPGVGYLFGFANVATVQLPLYAGYTFGGGHELVVGPRVTALFGTYDHESFDVALGSTLGIGLRIASRWRVMPEVSVQRTVRDPVWAASGGVAFIHAM